MKVLVLNLAGQEDALETFTKAGHEVVFGRPSAPGNVASPREAYSEGELMELCHDVHVVLGPTPTLTRAVMEASPLLHTLVVPVIGYERVDVQGATDLGIIVCNSPTPENFVSVSEATIASMTMLAKRLKIKEARVRNGEWSQNEDRGFLLWQKTVGIIGLGRTGSGVAKRLGGWEVRLLCHDPYISQERAEEFGVEMVDLPTLLHESDFVTIHVVITPETYEIIGEEQLRIMKPNAYLVNTSRGEAIEEVALRQAIEENWIAGAALDVFHQEPLPVDSPMRSLDPDRVILTPHSIAHTHASFVANRAMALETAITALNGDLPVPVVNHDAIPKWKDRIKLILQTA